MSETPKAVPARLDPHGTEKPLTRIVHHPHPNHCAGPGIALKHPEYETESGERIPLAAPKDSITCEVGTSGEWHGALFRQGSEDITEAIAFHGSDSHIRAEAVQEYLSQLPQEILLILHAHHKKAAEES